MQLSTSRPRALGTHQRIRRGALFTLYLVTLIMAELLAAGPDIPLGLSLHAALLVMLLIHSVIVGGRDGDFCLALAVLPLVRLLSLSMPLSFTSPINWYPLVNVPVIAATVTAAVLLGYRPKQLGLKFSHLWVQLPVAATGVAIGYIERQIIQPPALAAGLGFSQVLWPILSIMLFTGFSEEFLFRGLLLRAATRALGPLWGILYMTLAFSMMHIGWHSALDVAFVFGVGLYFGWVVHRTGSLFGTTLSHGIANVVLFIVLPLLH